MSQRGVVGVAAALDELRLEAGGVHRPADRRAAAVDDDRPHADRFHEDDVEQQVPQGVCVLHHAAAELDDRDLVAELADPAQGLDQHVGFVNGLFQPRELRAMQE